MGRPIVSPDDLPRHTPDAAAMPRRARSAPGRPSRRVSLVRGARNAGQRGMDGALGRRRSRRGTMVGERAVNTDGLVGRREVSVFRELMGEEIGWAV